MIKLQNVSFSYRDQPVLSDFNLEIETAITTVLIGPSGCGKSTILRLINGLLTPQNGSIEVNKTKLSKNNLRLIRLNSGYVIQEGGLFPNMSARENITLMPRRLNWPTEKISHRVDELCLLTHFPQDSLGRFPQQLSGGQRQRVSLMRALMLDPDVLLLDEPFAALDPLIRADLQESLLAIFKNLNKTVLMVTHDLNEAAFLGQRIILMKDGQIMQEGSIEELVSKPLSDFVSTFIKAQRSHLPGTAQ